MSAAVAHEPLPSVEPPLARPDPPVLHAVEPPPDADTGGRDEEAASFGKAIVVGILIGLPAMALLMAVAVKLVAPEISTAGVAAIAGWVALFCGPFLAGTITVGRWSSKHH